VLPWQAQVGKFANFIVRQRNCTRFLTSALDVWWSSPRPGRFTPGKWTLYSLYRRLGGSQGRSGRVRKISPLTGIRSLDRPSRSESDCNRWNRLLENRVCIETGDLEGLSSHS